MSEVPTSARVAGAIGRGLVTAGVVVLLFVVFQLWGTNIQEARAQDDLRVEFDTAFTDAQTQLAVFDATEPDETVVDVDTTPDPDEDLPAPTPTLPGGLTPDILRYFFPEGGDAVARIEIPTIGVDKIVVNGVQVADLRKGPGHYPGTAAVGTEGNSSIAGHRTTYGAPFNRIDELTPGDEIRLTSVLGTFTYRVIDPQTAFRVQLDTIDAQGEGHIIVRPDATWVLDDFGDNRVTLTACHPKLSSRQRIIVAAQMVEAPAEEPTFDPEVVAAFMGEDASEAVLPGEETDETEPDTEPDTEPETDGPATEVEVTSPRRVTSASLDEGLSGERDAIPGAALWMLAAVVVWVLAGIIGRHFFEERLRRIAVRVVALIPVAFCLWFGFEMIDRALPAG